LTPRILLVAGAAVVAAVLFLALRPGDDAGDETAPAATTASETTTIRPAATTTATAPPRRSTIVVRIVVRGGRPVGGIRRATVARGRRVRLVVRSDVADHVHLHGYDIMRDVAPGRAGVIVFRATIPGRFEAELEDRSLQILDLRVEP
jgi:hypothetical protein